MWKPNIQKIIKYLFTIICIVAFGIFIYPGIYKYDKLDQKYPVMINRITGETKILFSDTWSTVGNVDAQLSKFESYKNEIEDSINSQNEQIKEVVLESIRAELDQVKDQVIAETTNNLNEPNPTYEDGTSVFDAVRNRGNNSVTIIEEYTGPSFGKGDTQETVKNIMGVADTITAAGPFETWYYDLSYIKFEDGKVSGWNNIDKNLHLK